MKSVGLRAQETLESVPGSGGRPAQGKGKSTQRLRSMNLQNLPPRRQGGLQEGGRKLD